MSGRYCVCGYEAWSQTDWHAHKTDCPRRAGRQADHRDATDRHITLHGGDAA